MIVLNIKNIRKVPIHLNNTYKTSLANMLNGHVIIWFVNLLKNYLKINFETIKYQFQTPITKCVTLENSRD